MLSRKEFPLTMLLIAVCVGIYAGTLFIEDWDGGYYSADSIWEGTYWAYITSCFVHFDILHILFNLYWLFMLGQLIETEIGSFKMILIVFLSCIVTSGFQFLFTEDTGIGFSGVLYSFVGC